MSDQPEAKQKKAPSTKARVWLSDVLYVTGAVLVSIGLGFFGAHYGIIAAGVFCLFMPMLELTGSFLRGLLRAQQGNR
jgi:hypothetical protein